jgi:hypothetical protein
MDQSIKNALDLFDKDTGYQYQAPASLPTYPGEVPFHDYSIPLTSSKFPSPDRRVIVDGSGTHELSGASEALIQLGMAFKSFLPEGMVYWGGTNWEGLHADVPHDKYKREYGDVPASIPWIKLVNLKKGDVLILGGHEICPVDLLKKGVDVYTWHLALARHSRNNTGEDPKMKAWKEQGCKVIAHNFYLGVAQNLPPEKILRPYISPSFIVHEKALAKSKSKKENLILIDRNTPWSVKAALADHCKALGCTVTVMQGMKQAELGPLYDKAKIVVDWCLVGSERMPIEAGLRGALLVSSNCKSVKDFRDFPIPKRNIVENEKDALKEAIGRILKDYETELVDYEEFRALYRGLSAKTLGWEAKSFYFSIASSSSEQETVALTTRS